MSTDARCGDMAERALLDVSPNALERLGYVPELPTVMAPEGGEL